MSRPKDWCLGCWKFRPIARHSRCLGCARKRDREAKRREAARRAAGLLPPRDRRSELAGQRSRYVRNKAA